ncbi:hypothetical protein Pint_19716 [Pistacia integerrima]|uniref:Uncharacterized protein n=1 Tax=Pistacia integerrima TaxID=434235 RepID=A0ACC0XAQ0_9ROSI|nr:hypothetical protein Pint_19716 [Pistacia integerrima]
MQTCILEHVHPFPPGQNHQFFSLEDEEGQMWRFNLTIRDGVYEMPLLSAGWRQFVQGKNLQNKRDTKLSSMNFIIACYHP